MSNEHPNFFICDNPLVNDGTDYLLYLNENSALLEVKPLPDNQVEKVISEDYKPDNGIILEYLNMDNENEYYTLNITHLFNEQASVDAQQDILKSAKEWYKELLQFEDNTTPYNHSELEPYCAEYPDLFIENDLSHNTWLCTYRGQTHYFDLDDDMWEFILHELQLILPEEGVVNEY